jgi:hypothetical protein
MVARGGDNDVTGRRHRPVTGCGVQLPPMRIKSASALAGVALLVAGCGSADNNAGTASGHSSHPGIDSAYKFASCMRNHGLSSFPDPIVHQSAGHTEVGLKITPAISGSPAFKSAQNACMGFLPGPGANATETAAQIRARRTKFLSFAQCMRAHGVSSFPDPTPDGQITQEMLAAANINVHLTSIQQAAIACIPASGGLLTKQAIYQASHTGTGGSGTQSSG